MTKRAVFPGTFNPPTIAHAAIVKSALTQLPISALDVVISKDPLGKRVDSGPSLTQRIDIVRESFQFDRRISVLETDLQLLADISEGYDYLVVGGDKLAQLNDPHFYTDLTQMRHKLALLPPLVVAKRGAAKVMDGLIILDIKVDIEGVSSTLARAGDTSLMTEAAKRSQQENGYWSG